MKEYMKYRILHIQIQFVFTSLSDSNSSEKIHKSPQLFLSIFTFELFPKFIGWSDCCFDFGLVLVLDKSKLSSLFNSRYKH